MSLAAGTRLDSYEIVAPLGAGGMGEVYRAFDTRLNREVAIKVLPECWSRDPERLHRFELEAQAAAALNHPNIISIHHVGQHDGSPYIVTELLQGETLRERLKKGPMRLREALDEATEIAQGLGAAHDARIIHRDLKPENIFITKDGRVKILDFGLAKLGPAESTDVYGPTVTLQPTSPGHVLGTVGYMSPEQVRGQTADARTDIFAAGAVLYEMLTGTRAFQKQTAAETMSAILNEDPPAISQVAPNLPPGLERIVSRCLSKNPEQRIQHATDLAFALEAQAASSGMAAVMEKTSAKKWICIAGGIAAIAVATAAFIWRKGPPALPVVKSATQLDVRRWFSPMPNVPAIRSLAVLPLQNLSGDPAQEYFADGMTEELITELSSISALKVISRTSVMRYKKTDKSLPEIARELHVDGIVEGSVVRDGNEVRITAQLIYAPEDKNVWAQSFERQFQDSLTLQSEVASAIAGAVRTQIEPDEKARLQTTRPVNPEAYVSYLKGRYFWNKRTGESLKKAIEYFNEAIAKDPTYAQSYAGLADSYSLLSEAGPAVLRPQEMYPKAKAAAIKALQLDNSLAEAHTSLAFCLGFFEWQWDAAEQEYRKALALNPGYATAHQWYAMHLSSLARYDESIAEMKKAESLDPLSLIISAGLADVLFGARRYDESIQQSRKAIDIDANFAIAHYELGQGLAQKGMYNEAIAELRRANELSGGDPTCIAVLAYAYAASGRNDEAVRLLNELPKHRFSYAAHEALVYSALHDKQQAISALENAYQEHFDVLLLRSPAFDPLRSEPEFRNLMQRIGLPQ
jgi:serine/threonine protein kinase/tetratricopeptide (TPR) repeat protein